jgi:hypothetical protein
MNGARRAARALHRTARRLASLVAELRHGQRWPAVFRLSAHRHLTDPDAAPDTYAEFLARTRGPRISEPSARARIYGRPVG